MLRSIVGSGRSVLRLRPRSMPVSAQMATVAEAPLPITTLTEEEEMLKQSVAQFAREKVAPLVRAMDRDMTMPTSLIQDLHAQGVLREFSNVQEAMYIAPFIK